MKIGIALAFACMLGGAFVMNQGCGPSTAANVKTAADYEAEQLVCVDKAKSLVESRACRCKVMAEQGRECPWPVAMDGGAP